MEEYLKSWLQLLVSWNNSNGLRCLYIFIFIFVKFLVSNNYKLCEQK
jgi:hypothetical protein